MTLSRHNPLPRLPQALQPLLTERDQQYVVIDIGARGGVDPLWSHFIPVADFVAFEPDAKECERLGGLHPPGGAVRISYVPLAIGAATGTQRFYATKFPYSSGFHRGNDAWLSRFPFTTLDVVDEIDVATVSLDDFAQGSAWKHMDFLKIDVEGAEYDVLAGASTMLRSHKVLGIKTEFWWDPVIKSQRAFADIDTLLRANGFRFFDLVLHTYPRSTLPMGRIDGTITAGGLHLEPPKPYGQAFTGDALYFRDPVGDLREGRPSIAWEADTLLRLCGILDVYDYGDCAIEILEAFRDSHLSGIDVDPLMDALVPVLAGSVMRYGDYRELSNQIRQRANQQQYGLGDWTPPPMKYRKHQK